MATTNPINFFAPGTDAAVDMQSVQRQRDLASLLMRSSFDPSQGQGQMVSGHYVAPSPISALMPALNFLAAGKINERADADQRKLAEALRSRNAQEANDFLGALNGGPGKTIQPLTPNDDEGNPMPVAQGPAVAPDKAKALALALQSQNPQIQAMGGELMKQQIADQRRQQLLSQFGFGGQPGTAGGSPGASPGMGGIDPRVIGLVASGDPALEKLGGFLQDTNKPIPLREGDLVVPDGGGGYRAAYSQPKLPAGMVPTRSSTGQVTGATVLPGFQQGNAAIAGAESGAKAQAQAPFNLRTVDTASGPRLMSDAQALQQASGGMSNPTEQGMARNAVINDNPAADANREIAALKSDLEKVKDAPSKKIIQAEIDRLSGQVEKYAGRGSINPPQGGPGIALQSDDQKAYGQTRAKGFAEQASGLQKAGQQSAGMLRNLDELRTLYSDPNVAKGALAENISGLKNIGASFGIDMKGLSSEQAASAITNKMALDLRSTADGGGMPGAMSDADREFLKALTPNLTKSPEGRAKIMDAAQKVAQRQIDIARMANQYEQQNGRLDAGFDKVVQDYAAKNQLFTQPAKGGGFKILGVQ